jgi:dTDP-4-dehydrorhamnose reductase
MSATPSPPPSPTTSKNGVTVHLILTGASGYLGQHLLSHWIEHGILPPSSSPDVDIKFKISALYHKSESFPKAVREFRQKIPQQHPGILEIAVRSIDLTDTSDIESLVQTSSSVRSVDGSEEAGSSTTTTTTTTIVVHAAALSSPRACQENPEVARAINVPTKFFNAFLGSSFTSDTKATTSILALSTDQVYDGRQKAGSHYKENEEEGLNPINVYGQTKLELEKYLLQQQHQQQQQQSSSSSKTLRNSLVALRSSIILGPKAPIDPDCAHGTFLDFCRSRGQAREATTFFTNEYRSVVRVDRVIQTLGGFISPIVAANNPRSSSLVVYNMGGPVRVNRMELAGAVFDKFGYDRSLLVKAEQTSPMSPLDISMDSSLLFEEGILRKEYNDTEKDHPHEDSETYLKNLVDYVFGVE